MNEPKSEELIHAEELINEGKTKEALEIVRKYQQTGWTYYFSFNYDKALKIAIQSKELIEKIGKESDYATNFYLLGHIYLFMGNYKKSLNYGMKCMEIAKNLDDRAFYASSLWFLALYNQLTGNSIKAIEFSKKSLSINKIRPHTKAANLNLLSNIHFWEGAFIESLKYAEEGIQIAEEIEADNTLTELYYLKALVLSFMNDFDRAKEFLLKSLELSPPPTPWVNLYRAWALLGIIFIFIEENSINEVEKYLEILKKFADKTNSKSIFRIYNVTKGITLFQSSRTRDRAEAEKLFKAEIDRSLHNEPYPVSYMYALYSLILLYIEELRSSNDLKVLEDLNPLITLMYEKAEQLHSNLFLSEGKIFQAKIEIILQNIDNARRLLTEAQEIAESSNNHFFAQMISEEHDRLLELQDNQEKLESLQKTKIERIKLASLKGRISITQREDLNENPELIPEIPVLLLIIGQGGVLLFSYPFTSEWKHDTEIFGSFLSAFTSFSDEFFSKGLDRAKFGEDTLLMHSVGNYSIGYLYKGQSYPAKQKLTTFAQEIQVNTSIWQNFEKFVKTSQVAEVRDLPQIENLIKDIFILS